jgi:DNA (cytosine-5)-methyltransferase 1
MLSTQTAPILKPKFTAVDLFAGLGGSSDGARRAGGQVVYAANHNPLAVEYHAKNHPGVMHVCQDLQQADWSLLPSHDILMASPCCQGHSPARGKDRPHHDKQRSTAWAVLECADFHREDVIVVENVTNFLNWVLYPVWLDGMNKLGYSVSPHIIDAADHGVPQNRERVFLVCTRSKNPLQLKFEKKPHVPISSVIDWDRHKWNPINKPTRVLATLKRIASGRAKFGPRFVTPYYGSGSGETGRSIDRPIGTLTTVDRWAIINGEKMRMIQAEEEGKLIMGFDKSCQLPKTKKEAMQLLGNAVSPPVMCDVLEAIHATV